MKILLGYENSLCRDFINDHLTHLNADISLIVASTLRESMQIAAETPQMSVIALDTEMPDMNGVVGLRQMIAQCSGQIPVALIGSMRRSSEIRGFLTAGAAGYLTYSLSAQALLAGLQMINVGEIYVPADVLAQDEKVTRTGRHWLTGRERDVLNGLLSGQSNKEIARTHGLSEVTIKHHLKSLRSKLGARNRTHAVCRAIELGIAEEAIPAAS